MTKAIVNKIIPFSSVDGPGNRMAIFLQGCNFDCLYCHNPETISRCISCGKCVKECPYEVLKIVDDKVIWDENLCKHCDKCLEVCQNNSSPKTMVMSVEEIIEEIKKIKSFISGITVSGGECGLQKEFLIELFTEVKKMGLTTFMDTNGSIPLYDNKDLINVMDKAMIDVKSYDSDEHIKLTGMDNKTVIENVKRLADIDKLYEIRTVIVPDILSNEYNVNMISKLLVALNPEIRYKLIKYRPVGVRKDKIHSHVPSDELMNNLKAIAKSNGCRNVILV